MTKNGKFDGLANVTAGATAICTVGKEGTGLTYRGYSIEDLAGQARFEEIAYLLLYGELPTEQELNDYDNRLMSLRGLPAELKAVLEQLPGTADPMDVMRTGCSVLGCIEPECTFDQQYRIAERMLALFPSILAYWYRFHRDGIRIDTESEERTVSGYFLHLLSGTKPPALHQRALDVSLILYAEHEFNASTFAARVAASTLSDMYSCVTAAIGTLRGPLHGGANEAAMELISRFDSIEDVEPALKTALARKEKIMGFGHRVYNVSDPRSPIIEGWSRRLADDSGDDRVFRISKEIETVMWQQKKLFPNLDFYSASTYHYMGIPVPLYTPIFVCSRVSGWAAHIMEQRADNALIRPTADYVGSEERSFVPMEKRHKAHYG